MDLEKFERDLKAKYRRTRSAELSKRVHSLVEHIENEWKVKPENLTLHELKILSQTVLETETEELDVNVEDLLAQKERIERELERKSAELQKVKYEIFDDIEKAFEDTSKATISKIHQIKLQSIDLFDLLEEMVESAILTAIEKDKDIEESLFEVTKEITYETIEEGSFNTIRIRKIISTIFNEAIKVAEAAPNRAEGILKGTLKGIRSALIRSIENFKKELQFMPEESKSILVDDYDTLRDEIFSTDNLFKQVIKGSANKSDESTKKIIKKALKDIEYDMDELVHISKETIDVMKSHFSTLKDSAYKRGSKVLSSDSAKEAKKMGQEAFGIAKSAMNNAIKSAKDVIEKK